MFNSQILDVAIGMIFVYLLLSLMCSAANEIIESLLKKRAKHLEEGLRELLQNQELIAKVYNHSLVNGLFGGKYAPKSRKLPSYIPSENFALALMDLVLPGQAGSATTKSGAADAMVSATPSPSPPQVASATVRSGAADAMSSLAPSPSAPQVMINVAGPSAPGAAAPGPTVGVTAPAPKPNALDPLRNALQNFPYPEVRQALLPLVDAAGNDAARARQNIEDWFNSSMDRVSGWYKRRAQVMLLIIGFIVTMGVNADSIIVAKRLASDRALRESVVAAADAYAKANATSGQTPSPTPTPAATPKASGSPAAKPSATPVALASAPTPKPSVTPEPSPVPDTCLKDDCADPESPKCKLKMSQCKLQELGLPIGWILPDEPQTKWPGLHFWTGDFWTGWYVQTRIHFLGWLLTALAISLGAPFWFDMLNKFIVVRGTVKPKEKSGDEKSKD